MMADPDTITVRSPGENDEIVLAELIGQTGFHMEPIELVRQLKVLHGRGDWVRVAEVGDRVAGVITMHDTPLLHRTEPVARVTLLVVGEGFRGSGVGTTLMKAAEQAAHDRGIGVMEVISHHRYADAHVFYERLGYEQSSLKFKKALS